MSALIAVPDNKFSLANYTLTTFSGAATSFIGVDAAYPIENVFSTDTTEVVRINYTRNSSLAAPIRIRIRFSNTEQYDLDALAALNVRLDPHVSSVGVYAGTFAGAASGNDGQEYARAQLIPIDGTTDRFNLYGIRSNTGLRGEIWLTIAAPINVSGYVEIGHMWASQGLVLPQGVDGNWQVSHVDHGEGVTGPGGGLTAAVRPRTRRIVAPITGRTYTAAMGTPGAYSPDNLDAILQAAGTTNPLLFIGRDDDTHSLQKLSAFCHIESVDSIGHAGGNYFGTQLTMNQLR